MSADPSDNELRCGAPPGEWLEWLEARPGRARLDPRPFADGWIIDARYPPVRLGRRGSPRRPAAGYQLVLHEDGEGTYRYRGRVLEQAPGDIVLLDTALPCEVVHPAGACVRVWNVPTDALGPLLTAQRGEPAHHLPGRHPLASVLRGSVQSLVDEAERLDASSQGALQTHLCGLVALALGPYAARRASRREANRTLRRQQILTYLEAHLRDPALGAASAARALGMSRRWLHALLEGTGESFAARVTRRRLEEVRRLLQDPSYDGLSISEVAFRSGFNDLSTFHRRFRARYGQTPRDARRGRRDERPGDRRR